MKHYLRKRLYAVVQAHKKREAHKFKKGDKSVSKWTKLQLYNHIVKHKLGLPATKAVKVVKKVVKKVVVKKVVVPKKKCELQKLTDLRNHYMKEEKGSRTEKYKKHYRKLINELNGKIQAL